MSRLSDEVRRRRTFAIISHPDAGKTTLTEKLLLYGGAIHLAGSVKARRAARHATSDWMQMEQERGISVTSSVLQFEYLGREPDVDGTFEGSEEGISEAEVLEAQTYEEKWGREKSAEEDEGAEGDEPAKKKRRRG